jgi:hypothetical protein
VLGPLQITAAGREIGTGLRKARELLAFLAVHPDGASGEAISEALWPESDPGRAAGQRNLALRKAREMLRTASALPAPMWILNASGRYRLDPALIGTDLEAFSQALEEARNASGDARLAACRRAVALYRGELAEGTGYEWAEPYAEAARRRALVHLVNVGAAFVDVDERRQQKIRGLGGEVAARRREGGVERNRPRRLHETGLDIAHSKYQRHSAYLLQHADMPGFPREEQLLLSALVGGHRRQFSVDLLEDLLPPWDHLAEYLVVVLRLAVLLHRGRSPQPLPEVQLRVKGRSVNIVLPQAWMKEDRKSVV